jgi:multicomponent Na+:H+ antiporter subunit A
MGFLVILTGYNVLTEVKFAIPENAFADVTLYETIVLAIMVTAVGFAVFTTSRLLAVSAMGVMGYTICLIFVFYSAPDLAMTQFAIDTLTVILFLLVLYRLPKYLKLSDLRSRLRDGIMAIAFGALITVLALEVLSEPINRETSAFYAENAYVMAKGKNVVNVILVDFRGIDTLVEITVLVIAAIGVFGLLKLRLRKSEIEEP